MSPNNSFAIKQSAGRTRLPPAFNKYLQGSYKFSGIFGNISWASICAVKSVETSLKLCMELQKLRAKLHKKSGASCRSNKPHPFEVKTCFRLINIILNLINTGDLVVISVKYRLIMPKNN